MQQQRLGSAIWRKMYHYVQLNRDEFLKHYHLSNVESTFAMLKAKFSDLLRSKNRTAQVNELLLKILCHNIVVINNEVKHQLCHKKKIFKTIPPIPYLMI